VRNPELVDVLVKVQEGVVKLREESVEVSRPAQNDHEREKRSEDRPRGESPSAASQRMTTTFCSLLNDAEDVARN